MAQTTPDAGHDPLAPHSHEPNPEPPTDDPTFVLELSDGATVEIGVEMLGRLPRSTADRCYIVSTSHGTSGPFEFSGVSLADFARQLIGEDMTWSSLEVVGADGFGTRVTRLELFNPLGRRSALILLADTVDGQPLGRPEGLVRLVAPGETDDALRQIKWVSRIKVRP